MELEFFLECAHCGNELIARRKDRAGNIFSVNFCDKCEKEIREAALEDFKFENGIII